jgi:hypothetical protein
VLGAVTQFEKANLVAKLRAARIRAGRQGGQKPGLKLNPRAVEAARSLRGKTLREIAARLAEQGLVSRIHQLAFEGGEETLAHRIVVGVADRACRWTNAGLLAAIAESDRRVLRTADALLFVKRRFA